MVAIYKFGKSIIPVAPRPSNFIDHRDLYCYDHHFHVIVRYRGVLLYMNTICPPVIHEVLQAHCIESNGVFWTDDTCKTKRVNEFLLKEIQHNVCHTDLVDLANDHQFGFYSPINSACFRRYILAKGPEKEIETTLMIVVSGKWSIVWYSGIGLICWNP